jgi:hypothetical protein
VPMAGLRWQRDNGRWQTGAELRGGWGSLHAAGQRRRIVRFLDEDFSGAIDTVDVPVTVGMAPLSFGLTALRSVTPADARLRVAAGGSLRDDWFFSTGFVRPGLMHAATLSPTVALDYGRDDLPLRFELGVSVALVAWRTRMPYHGSVSLPGSTPTGGLFQLGSAWRLPDSYRAWSAYAGLRYRLGEHWQLGLQYTCQRRHDTRPRPLDVQQQGLTATIIRH